MRKQARLIQKQQTVLSTEIAGRLRKTGVTLGVAFVGWALCAAIMGIGISVTSLSNALVIHAIGAPIIFALLTLLYFRKFYYATPLITAVTFTAFVMTMDFFIVGLVIQRSLVMFESVLGTWLPFALIFLSTCLTSTYVVREYRMRSVGAGHASSDL
jgi:hypothetical protein